MKRKIIEIKDLTFAYEKGKNVLDHVSADIYENEKIAVLGSNGAGKSTFFLSLNGVRKPDKGEIILYGNKVNKKNRNELRKKTGIVFQDADSQMIASTVKAEIAFGPLNMKLPYAEVEKRTMDAINKLHLMEYAERPPHYLSGGEKKRVSIADILAMDPPIIIFDEPTASLDPENADMLERILSHLQQQGKTILLATHDVDFAFRFADRIFVFCDGKIIADGTAQEIFLKEEVLKKANLRKPVLMQIYELLKEKEKLVHTGKYPKTLEELGNYL